MRWQVVSVPASDKASPIPERSRVPRAAKPSRRIGRGRPAGNRLRGAGPLRAATRGRERISQLVTPGSSLIVSDHGHNREMRDTSTDFIVLTR